MPLEEMRSEKRHIVARVLIHVITICEVTDNTALMLHIDNAPADDDRSQVVDAAILLRLCLLVRRRERLVATADLVLAARGEHEHFAERDNGTNSVHLPARKRSSDCVTVLLRGIDPEIVIVSRL